MNGSAVTPELNNLHAVLVDLVNSMRVFFQISTNQQNRKYCCQAFIFSGHQYFHLLHLRISVVQEWIRNDTIAKGLTWYVTKFNHLNEKFSSNISHHKIEKILTRIYFSWYQYLSFAPFQSFWGQGVDQKWQLLNALHDILASLVN